MSKRLIISFCILIAIVSHGQSFSPVQWSFYSNRINATTVELRLVAQMQAGWHLYSQHTPDGGPIPTGISFVRNPLVVIMGAVKEKGKLEEHFEELFGVVVKQYSDKVEFVQQVQVKAGLKTAVKGTVEYMTCNDRECMPPKKQAFSINI